jgi:alpha-D-xyloside xylohydrolase
MVGPDVLAAPVTADRAETDGAAGEPTPVSVYLPAGTWVDLYSGRTVTGGRTVTRPTGPDEFPLYLRTGTAIGFHDRAAGDWGTDDLSRPDLSGWMYAPGAGDARPVSSDQGRLDASTRGGTVRLRLTGAPAKAQVRVLLGSAPGAVTVNGHPLPKAADATALRATDDGWTFTPGPFGGVVLKLRPHGGAANVTIR